MRLSARVALAASFLLFVPGLLEQFEAPKAAAIRVLGMASLTTGLASTRGLRSRRWGWVDAAVLACLIVEIVVTLFSDSPLTSLLGEPEQRGGLLTTIALAGLYLAARLGSRSPSAVRRTLDVALVSAALAGLYAIAQALGIDPLTWSRTSGLTGLAVRPFGTLGHPNLLGLVTGAATSAALAMTLRHRTRRFVYGIVAALCAAATVLTLSRGAFIGAASGLIAVGLLARRAGTARAIPERRHWIAAAVLLAALAGALVTMPQWRALLHARLLDSIAADGGSTSARIEIWRAALAAWQTRPVLGHGPDSFALVFPRYQTAEYWRVEWSGLPFHAHSIYLHVLATRGLLGVAAAGGLFAALLAAARSAWRAGEESRRLVTALGGALVATSVSGLFGSVGMSGMVWITLIAASLATLAEGDAPPAGSAVDDGTIRSASARIGPLIAGATMGLVALGWATADLVASAVDRRGLALIELSTQLSGERVIMVRRAAAHAYERATEWMPFDDAIFRRRADSLRFLAEVDSDPELLLGEADWQARRAVALAPLRALNHRYLGLILLSRVKLGDPSLIPAGEAAYARCMELAPHDVMALIELARAELELGRPRQAIGPASRAVAIDTRHAEALLTLAKAHQSLGEYDQARTTLVQALRADWRGNVDRRREAARILQALMAAGD